MNVYCAFLSHVTFLSSRMIKHHFLHEFFPFLLSVLMIPSLLLGDACSD